MESFAYLRYASRLAQRGEELAAKRVHAELALRAGVLPEDYVSPWIEAARLVGPGGVKRHTTLISEDVRHLVYEKHDLTCVILTVKNHDGRMQVENVKPSKATFERIVEKFGKRDVGHTQGEAA